MYATTLKQFSNYNTRTQDLFGRSVNSKLVFFIINKTLPLFSFTQYNEK